MFSYTSPNFSLENFEGPLELLLYLIQKEEIDVCEITLKELTSQFMRSLEQVPEVETNAEVLMLTTTLLLMKSQKLLPSEEQLFDEEEIPRAEMIRQLIEYCRFKEAANILLSKEEEQKAFFPRAAPPYQKELGSGLEDVGLEELKALLLDVMARAKKEPEGVIQEEEWQTSSKIEWFLGALRSHEKIPLFEVFSEEKCRAEVVVLFLALLELMKLQELKIVKENEELYIISYESGT